MPQSLIGARGVFEKVKQEIDNGEFETRLKFITPEEKPLPGRVPAGYHFTQKGLKKRRKFLREQGITLSAVEEDHPYIRASELRGNIENLIGFCQIPVGVIGPLRICGFNANGDFFVPLATTEGALVASYNRGATAISHSGGVRTFCMTESVSRAPWTRRFSIPS